MDRRWPLAALSAGAGPHDDSGRVRGRQRPTRVGGVARARDPRSVAARQPRGFPAVPPRVVGGRRGPWHRLRPRRGLAPRARGAAAVASPRLPAGPVDGRFGPRTRAAVMWFQIKHGLPRSGRVDAAGIATLREKRGDGARPLHGARAESTGRGRGCGGAARAGRRLMAAVAVGTRNPAGGHVDRLVDADGTAHALCAERRGRTAPASDRAPASRLPPMSSATSRLSAASIATATWIPRPGSSAAGVRRAGGRSPASCTTSWRPANG